ncbi:MAG: DNA-processing protein DprA [Pseudomonadota bacterium]
MDDFLSEDTKATLLLCASFGNDATATPLSLGEYAHLVQWLVAAQYRPQDLLSMGSFTRDACRALGLDVERMNALLSRGLQLGFAIEEWQRYGIWIMGRSDADYPARYKVSLKDKAPPILFGVGDRSLLLGGGLAVVGSRTVDDDAMVFTQHVGKLCAHNGMPVVSGCAKGVDQIAMQSALQCGGYSIGIVADALLKRSVEQMHRKAIARGSLLLLSPHNPTTPFAAWAAMDRNKLIYAMADYGLVVRADLETGGTWGGAREELKREHGCPLFVRENHEAAGNVKLIQLGALPWPLDVQDDALAAQLQQCMTQKKRIKRQSEPSLFDFLAPQDDVPVQKVHDLQSNHDVQSSSDVSIRDDENTTADENTRDDGNTTTDVNINVDANTTADENATIYDIVLPFIIQALETSPHALSSDELCTRLDIHKTQLSIWLNKALDDKKIQKCMRPVRYTVPAKS